MATDNLAVNEQQALQHQDQHSKRIVAQFRQLGWHVEYDGPEDLNWIKLTQPGVQAALRVSSGSSKSGLNNGCISQLEIRSDTAWIFAYDEGPIYDAIDTYPGARAVFRAILTIAN